MNHTTVRRSTHSQTVSEGVRIAHDFPQWYHIWFLVALLLYTPAAYLLHGFDMRYNGLLSWPCAPGSLRYAQPLLLIFIPLVSLCFMQVSGTVVLRTAPPFVFWQLWQLRLITGYLPLFLLGFILARSPSLLQEVTKRAAVPGTIIMIMGACYIARHTFHPALSATGEMSVDETLLGLGSAICPPSMTILVMRSASALKSTHAHCKRLADASLTIYLVHLPIIIAINGLFAWLSWNEIVEWTIAVSLTLLFSLMVHERLVRRWAFTRLLFNGERPRSSVTRAVRT